MAFLLSEQLKAALASGDLEGLAGAPAAHDRDALATLHCIYELWTAPLDDLDGAARFQNHPVVAELKWRFDQWLVDYFDVRLGTKPPNDADIATAMRSIARGSNDGIYDWLATSADWEQLVAFLAIEGGPDGGFDDLVALCQVGLHGEPKSVLAENYWDEMGRGERGRVHTTLHDQLVAALPVADFASDALPESALFRTALNGLLATNRYLQPEMVGALGLLELQAGPRCRRVLRALQRLGAPADAFPFYAEHAEVDPHHGKAWLDGVVTPLVEANPQWADRIVRGARWRADANNRLFRDVHTMLATRELQSA